MKNALILHGTGATPKDNWFSWLGDELKDRGWKVWVPDLPGTNHPNTKRYRKFIFANKNWQFDENSVLIGHSSSPLVICNLLQNLPDEVKVDTCIFVGAFRQEHDWDLDTSGLFIESYHWDRIKTKAKKFILIHSDDDPYCPLEDAQWLAQKLNGELIIKPGQKHFSISPGGPKYKKFPFLLKLIENKK